MTSRRPARLLLVPLAITLSVGGASWGIARWLLPAGRSDVSLYARYADAVFAGRVPFRDVAIEYPPGALVAFLLPRLAGPGAYHALFGVLMAACGVVLVLATDALLRRLGLSPVRQLATVACLAAMPLVLGPIAFERYDLLPAALVALALLAAVDERWTSAGLLLGLGALAKIYPAVLVPVVVVFAARTAGRRAAARAAGAFAAGLIVPAVPVLAVAGTSALHALGVQVDRPLQIESSGAALLHAAHQLGLVGLGTLDSYGSTNLGGTLPRLVAAVLAVASIAAVATVTWLSARARPTRASLVLAAAAMLLVTVALGKVLSPQYLIWLVPAALLLQGRRGTAVALATGVAAVLTNVLYPGLYPELTLLEPAASWLLVGRDLVLVALAAVVVHALALARAVPAGGMILEPVAGVLDRRPQWPAE